MAKTVGVNFNRDFRNTINENVAEQNEIKAKIDESAEKSQTAVNKSDAAVTLTDSLQAQLDNLVIAGDSSVEAAQARVEEDGTNNPNLKARLDNTDKRVRTDLEQREINVRTPPYNLKGDGSDESSAIQSLFTIAKDNGSVKLYFPKGTYGANSSVRLYKNTSVSLHPQATIKRVGGRLKGLFVNGELDNFNYAVGYSGEGNIHFTGGTIDLNSQNTGQASTDSLSAFDLGHGENISFTGVKVINGQNGHYFQVSSCKNVRFYDCWFGNVRYTNTSSTDYELIQIEEMTDNSFPAFGGYDQTISRDITIEKCTFKDVIRAIGNHSFPKAADGMTPARYNENIVIKNNTFSQVSDDVFHLEAFRNVTMKDNVLEDVGGSSYYLSYTSYSKIENSRISRVQKSAVHLSNSHYNEIKENRLSEIGLATGYAAYRGVSSNYNEFSKTVISGANVLYSYPIYITDSTGNRINERNLPSGNGSNNGGKIYVGGGTSFNDTTFGPENVLLFEGALNMTSPTANLAEDIRGFSTIVVMGNDNSSATLGMTSMVIPKIAIVTGSATSQFRFSPDVMTSDRIDYSFPSYTSVRADFVNGVAHVRKIIGIR